ncbi:putative vacuolar amino acid transporter 3 [Rosellinia necatrix]|uniref:Putative vacuolar amino acid transporter 3 n=1 Tax=Rosellinia necatrix TaxID=77044 RepID=A0A1W2TQH9_ROSNE|nr:putative vacuolar amino acid transporter 3 [Rosellinia necatrix]
MAESPASEQSQPRPEAEVIAEHLPAGYTAEFTGAQEAPAAASSSAPNLTDPTSEEDSLNLQGGDIHRDIFKAAARVKMHKRAATFHHPSPASTSGGDDLEGLTVTEQLAPGGFRRDFLRRQNQQDETWASRMPITRNFVEFLDLYGSFAGEDLAESDDEAIISDEEDNEEEPNERLPPEARPLLGARRSSRGAPKSATASTRKTFFTLLKAFVGTGIMFLPKAFDNGGLLFSSITMVVVSAVTMVAFHLLLACKARYGDGYGDIGAAISGSRMRFLILFSITLSQLGFVCSGMVFVAENLQSFLEAVTGGHSPLSPTQLILVQLVVLVPLSFIRRISHLSPVAVLADIFILIGVSYIYYYDIAYLAAEGMNPTVVLFNPSKYTLMIGSAIFTFEGIGLILPIQSSMAKPERFEWLLGSIMVLITIIFTAVGALCYATFGTDTSIEIINNYPQTSKFVNAVQFLYSLAVLGGNPVQLFPAIRILETGIFGHRSGKQSLRTKWKKNALRTFLVLVCGGVAIAGTGNLDKFVALIGSVACVPLVYVYPAYLHYRGIATSRVTKIGDLTFMAVGLVAMVYTTIVTVVNSFM